MQLMLLEQQNKKKFLNMAPGTVGPNGQPSQGTSPGGRDMRLRGSQKLFSVSDKAESGIGEGEGDSEGHEAAERR